MFVFNMNIVYLIFIIVVFIKILTIESETPTSATISWMIVAERDDENVYRSYPIDGRLVVEPLKDDPTIPTANT